MVDLEQISVTGFWQELGPNDMYLRQHIGKLTVGKNREWEVDGSLNGLDLFIMTDIPSADDVSKFRRFKISGSGLISALAHELLRPDQEAAANEALAPKGGE